MSREPLSIVYLLSIAYLPMPNIHSKIDKTNWQNKKYQQLPALIVFIMQNHRKLWAWHITAYNSHQHWPLTCHDLRLEPYLWVTLSFGSEQHSNLYPPQSLKINKQLDYANKYKRRTFYGTRTHQNTRCTHT